MSKILISFLGSNNYKECVYESEDKGKSSVVQYFQSAIAELYLAKDDKCYIFLTKDAEKKNWSKLETEFKKYNQNIIPVKNVPEGYSTEQIWDIFQIVYERINEKDDIILDITHGFRSLPMLTSLLLNYAKALKNITVNRILYGAFEVLGPSHLIENEYPDPKDRVAKIVDLTSFNFVQEWTYASRAFIETGSTEPLTNIAKIELAPLQKETKGSNATINALNGIIKQLPAMEMEILTNRGKLLLESEKISNIKTFIDSLKDADDEHLPALINLLNSIKSKLKGFGEDKLQNWMASVKWCIDHKLWQQAITQLQEGIVTQLCLNHDKAYTDISNRNLFSSLLTVINIKLPESKWLGELKDQLEFAHQLKTNDDIHKLSPTFAKLTQLRNDINHGGYSNKNNLDTSSLSEQVTTCYENVAKIFKSH